MRRTIAAFAFVLALALVFVGVPRSSLGQEPFPTPEGQLGGPVRLEPSPDQPTPPPPPPTSEPSPSPAPSPSPSPSPSPPSPSPPTPPPPTAIPSEPTASPAGEGSVEALVARTDPALVAIVPVGDGRNRRAASGFVIDDAGHVLTVASVARRADEFEVAFSSGEIQRGRLVGVDDRAGIAILQIDGPVSASVPLADDPRLQPGQEVVAVGAALGLLPGTVTTGVVSVPERGLPWAPGSFMVVQHSAPVAPGMEGGPLLDRSGRLVGLLVDAATLLTPPAVGTAGESPAIPLPGTPSAAERLPGLIGGESAAAPLGVSFAVTASTLARVVPDLIKSGRVAYPYLGVSVAAGAPDGAVVVEVEPNGPAATADIRPDDRLLAINDEAIGPDRPLGDVLLGYRPGETVAITVGRGDEVLTLTATLGARPFE